ncbi:ParB N-terminal domain-containing protein [Paenibacillus tengchongensis]|uniref:ParB N-terminal domain-containing protein n=1 Tax=Paenibacillus tengchongensis TaxID=2608684 RepID=UPI001C9E2663|nr:ParB N-terminal domain-containing protein [Paenibacillus tengchongensis]
MDNIKMHENFQPTRLEKTMSAILNDRMLINPIITTRINEQEYMIIDGVHRFLSLKELGFKVVACQIVEERDVELNMWSHLVKAGEWLKGYADKNVIVTGKELSTQKYAFKITDSKQESFYYYLNDDHNLMSYVNAMHNIVAKYSCKPFLRVSELNESEIIGEDILVDFYSFSMGEINKLVSRRGQLPTGVTHFSISNRLLNLKIPLEYLEPDGYGHSWLDFLVNIQQKLRYYPESVYICE